MSTAVVATKPDNQQSSTLAIVPSARMDEARKLSAVAKQSSRDLIECKDDPMIQAVVLANSISLLREALTPGIMSDLLKLADTPLGFRTDEKTKKDQPNFKYSDAVIKDCLIQAMIRGVRPTGNEFNILVGQCYITKDGFRRLLKEYPGFTDFKPVIGVPKTAGEGAIVHCEATWKLNGKEDSIKCEIPVKGVGCDLLLGKAESKLLRRIWNRITGSDVADVASGEDELTPTPSSETTGAA